MKIAYLDLSLNGPNEDYSLNPKRYGGQRIFPSLLKQLDNFHIYAKPECFENLTGEDRQTSCFNITQEQINQLKSNHPIELVIPNIVNYDILFGCYTYLHINTDNIKTKNVIWSVGYNETIHPLNKHLLLYNDYQNPNILDSETKIYKFILGKQLPEFKYRKKENFIFQCSRHTPALCSIDVASFCLKNNIKGYFAGPIGDGYPLLNFIDNKTTHYLGEISEKEKLDWTARSKLYTMLHNWNVPFSLSSIEALSLGTPIVCTHNGFFPSLISHEKNGFFVAFEHDLKYAWENAEKIKQSDCYVSILKYNHFNMMRSLFDCFGKILT